MNLEHFASGSAGRVVQVGQGDDLAAGALAIAPGVVALSERLLRASSAAILRFADGGQPAWRLGGLAPLLSHRRGRTST